LSNSAMNEAAKKKGLRYANEVFADRAYNDDGTLVSRKLEGALIHDENLAIKRVIKMIKESKVTSINGKEIDLKADSICVHGDNAKALEFVKKIKENLTKEQIQIKALNDFIN
ncbi:LamB/YcsF family protein, partial [Campylobacter coli]|nr:LamB/YcsF family protein [Campylobacter coli]